MSNPRLVANLRRRLVQAVATYRAEGRKLAGLDADALQEAFVAALDAWAASRPDSGRTLNDVNAEYMVRRQAAPLERMVGVVGCLANGAGGDPPLKSLHKEPVVVIAVGRILFAPCLGMLMVSNCCGGDDETRAVRDTILALARA
jgi:hypothetical protein